MWKSIWVDMICLKDLKSQIIASFGNFFTSLKIWLKYESIDEFCYLPVLGPLT